MTRIDPGVSTFLLGPWAALLSVCLITQTGCSAPELDDQVGDGGSSAPDAGVLIADAGPRSDSSLVADADTDTDTDADTPVGAVDRVLVGYWPNWGDLNLYSLEHAAAQGYNLLVIAFGRLEGTTADVVYLASIEQARRDAIKEDIAATKAAYPEVRIILSLGGANNTYSPNTGDAELDLAAHNIVDLLDDYDLDGIDFDVEYSTATITPLARKLRQLDANMLITAAPQVNYDAGWMLVTTGWSEDYTAAINEELFDYLFLQGYNTVFWGAPFLSNDAEFIKASYDELRDWVPQSVKIVSGVPATWRSASQASIHFANYTVQHNEANARPIATVTSLINEQVRAIRTAPGATGQFAGIMTWCTLDDAVYNNPPYAFAQGVKDCVVEDDCD